VVSGTALFLLQRWLKRKDARDERQEKDKARENVLIIKSINAVGRLTEATAVALKDGHTNGEMTDALKKYSEVDSELYKLKEIAELLGLNYNTVKTAHRSAKKYLRKSKSEESENES
jgi:DNA-directed RNA polymerase specialized sigma24 family protein